MLAADGRTRHATGVRHEALHRFRHSFQAPQNVRTTCAARDLPIGGRSGTEPVLTGTFWVGTLGMTSSSGVPPRQPPLEGP